jgi:hypothetical protein
MQIWGEYLKTNAHLGFQQGFYLISVGPRGLAIQGGRGSRESEPRALSSNDHAARGRAKAIGGGGEAVDDRTHAARVEAKGDPMCVLAGSELENEINRVNSH